MKRTILSLLPVAALTLAGCMGNPPAAKPSATTTVVTSSDPQTKHDDHKPGAPAEDTVKAERDKLSAEDRALVDAQEWCAISNDSRLGGMGAPVKVMVKDQPVFLCCGGCKTAALADPDKTLAKVEELKAKKKAAKPTADHSDAHAGQHNDAKDDAVKAERAKLNPEDQKLVETQEWCAISNDERLGEMGPPVKLMIKDQPVFLCCKGCEKAALADPDKTLAKVEELKAKKKAGKPAGDHGDAHAGHHSNATDADIKAAREKLSAEDRALADAQEWCPVMTDDRLGCSGAPIKLMIKDQPVFICCKGCEKEALANPDKVLAKVEELKAKAKAAKQPK